MNADLTYCQIYSTPAGCGWGVNCLQFLPGLSMLTFCCSVEDNISFYLCHVCGEKCSSNRIVPHVFSGSHYSNYLVSVVHTVFIPISTDSTYLFFKIPCFRTTQTQIPFVLHGLPVRMHIEE